VESAITLMKSDFSESLFLFVNRIIRTKIAVYEKCPDDLRENITRQAARLMENPDQRIRKLLKFIEFSMKNV